jgi:hypothetical protein
MNSQDTTDPLFASLNVINKARPLDTTYTINWLKLLCQVPFWVVLVAVSETSPS